MRRLQPPAERSFRPRAPTTDRKGLLGVDEIRRRCESRQALDGTPAAPDAHSRISGPDRGLSGQLLSVMPFTAWCSQRARTASNVDMTHAECVCSC